MSGLRRSVPVDDLAPYLDRVALAHGVEGAGHPWALAHLSGHSRRAAHRWITTGRIPEDAAERIADALGDHPGMIWGRAWWEVEPRNVPLTDEGYERALARMA